LRRSHAGSLWLFSDERLANQRRDGARPRTRATKLAARSHSSAAITIGNVSRNCGNAIHQIFRDGVDVKSLHASTSSNDARSADAIGPVDEDDVRRIQRHSFAEQFDRSSSRIEYDCRNWGQSAVLKSQSEVVDLAKSILTPI
jgi:hypothetical protein